MTELQKATRSDGKTLHIVRLDTVEPTYVVCWGFNGSTWEWGAVCLSLEIAEKVFAIRSSKRDFDCTKEAHSLCHLRSSPN